MEFVHWILLNINIQWTLNIKTDKKIDLIIIYSSCIVWKKQKESEGYCYERGDIITSWRHGVEDINC